MESGHYDSNTKPKWHWKYFANSLFDNSVSDSMIWKHTPNDIYSVRTAYHSLMDSLTLNDINFWVEGSWNLIWALQIPPKVNYLLWRILRRCLTSRDRLGSKHVPCDMSHPLWILQNWYREWLAHYFSDVNKPFLFGRYQLTSF